MKKLFTLLLTTLTIITLKAQNPITIPAAVDKWIEQQLAAAKSKTLLSNYNSEKFFSNDSARIVGYLKGYNRNMGFATGIVYCANELTRQDYPIVVEIFEDGRFDVRLPVNYPKMLLIDLKDTYIIPYIEPGQTLAMIIDWPAFIQSKEDKKYIWYKGAAGPVNNELNKIKMQRINYDQLVDKDVKEMAPMDFYNKTIQQWDAEKAALNQQFSTNSYLPPTKIIATNMLNEKYAVALFDFEMYRDYEKSSDSTNKVLQLQAPKEYYHFLKRFNFDDKSLLIPDNFSTFINRYEYSAPYKAIRTTVNKISGTEPARSLHKESVTDSAVLDFYGMQPNLIHSIANVRAAGWVLKYNLKNDTAGQQGYINSFIEKLNPHYLKSTATAKFNRLISSNTVSGEALPDNKAAAIFKKIIAPYNGKVLFVDFWATTCGPCVAGIKRMYDTRVKYKNNPDFEFIFITSDNESPKNDYEKFVKEQQLEHTIYLNIDEYRYMRELFAFNGIPHYIAVTADGKIINDFNMSNFKYELARLLPEYSDVKQ